MEDEHDDGGEDSSGGSSGGGLLGQLINLGGDVGTAYLKGRQPVAATPPRAVTPAAAPMNKTWLYIGGGVALLLVGWLVIRSMGGRRSA